MKDNQKEENPFRTKLDLEKRNNKRSNNEIIDKKIRSFSFNNVQLQKFIPKPKPIDINLNPSPIQLKGKKDIISEDDQNIKYNKKLSCQIGNLENGKEIHDYTNYDNGDEYLISDSSENDSKENEKIIDKKNKNKNIMDTDMKFYCISDMRQKMEKIHLKIKHKNYNDDSILNI